MSYQSADLLKTLTNRLETLAGATAEAARADIMRAFLETMAKFHSYSLSNQWLIYFANPNATHVAGYVTWRDKFHRQVRKGEHGIAILAPCAYKADPDDDASPTVVKGFRVVHVFDISQTEGEPLPEPPNWKSPAHLAALDQALLDFAQACEITVEVAEMGRAQGSSSGGSIKLDPTAGTKTLIHELAHELLHHGKEGDPLDPQTREIEAEATAFIVASHFGLPDLASPNYLALYGASAEDILARADRIRQTAALLINAVEGRKDLNQ